MVIFRALVVLEVREIRNFIGKQEPKKIRGIMTSKSNFCNETNPFFYWEQKSYLFFLKIIGVWHDSSYLPMNNLHISHHKFHVFFFFSPAKRNPEVAKRWVRWTREGLGRRPTIRPDKRWAMICKGYNLIIFNIPHVLLFSNEYPFDISGNNGIKGEEKNRKEIGPENLLTNGLCEDYRILWV